MIKLTRFSFFIFLISIPFGTRKFIYGFTPTFNEYGSIFLYASDILLVLFLILSYFTIFRKKSELFLSVVEKLSPVLRSSSTLATATEDGEASGHPSYVGVNRGSGRKGLGDEGQLTLAGREEKRC